MTETTTLRDLKQQLQAIRADLFADEPAKLDDDAKEERLKAFTTKKLQLWQQIALAPIASVEDARVKSRLVRRLQQEIGDVEDLSCYDGVVVRCIRELSEWLEAAPSSSEAGGILLSAEAAEQVRIAVRLCLQHARTHGSYGTTRTGDHGALVKALALLKGVPAAAAQVVARLRHIIERHDLLDGDEDEREIGGAIETAIKFIEAEP
jgi:hypothetical protein